MVGNKSDYKKAAKEIWTLLINSQNEDGGFPPYPGFITISGTIATTDFVSLLFRPPDIKGIIKNSKVADRVCEKAKVFILRKQWLDGGFVPDGDVYGIKEVSFVESTANSIVALLTYLRQKTNSEDQYIIKLSIIYGIKYLLEKRDEKREMWPTYETAKREDSNFRFFPFILALRSLVLFVDLYKELNFSKFVDKNFINNIIGVIKSGTWKIEKELSDKKVLPFSLSSPEKHSLVNTISAIEVLLSIVKSKEININPIDKIKKSIQDEISFILENAQLPEDHMDDDVILLNIPGYPSQYTATYRADMAISYVFSNILKDLKYIYEEENLRNQKLVEIKNYVENVLNEEIKKMEENSQYWVEERRVGRFVPATSSTCLLLATIKNYMSWEGDKTNGKQNS